MGRDALEGIVPVGLLQIGNIEVADVGLTVLGDLRHDPFDQVAMRIDERQSLTRFYIGENEPLEEGRLSCSGLADDVHMGKPIGLLNAENPSLISEVGSGEVGYSTRIQRHPVYDAPGSCPI